MSSSPAAAPAAAATAPIRRARPSFALSVWTLWLREVRGFYRQPARVAAGIATPLIFWFVLGSGFGDSMRGSAGEAYMEFFFPGAVALVVLFASIFSNISIIEDRREGFLLSVLAAPVPRSAMVIGKVLGATTIGALQGLALLPLVPLLEIPFEWSRAVEMGAIVLAMAFGLTSIGFFFAWWLNTVQGFHAVMNMVLMPMWLLSGALFPVESASPWIRWLTTVNPLTYGVGGLRRMLFGEAAGGPTLAVCWAVTLGFGLVSLALAVKQASRPSAKNLS